MTHKQNSSGWLSLLRHSLFTRVYARVCVCVCVCARTWKVLSVHTPVSVRDCILLPHSPVAMVNSLRPTASAWVCVRACVCLFMCATSWFAFNERCVHPCLFLWPFGAHACVSACVPPGARVLCNQTQSQMWSRGVMSQRRWEEEVFVLF